MKKILGLLLFLLPMSLWAQNPRGSLGVGFFAACPQHELKDNNYDPGWGMNINYMSRERAIAPAHKWSIGMRMDFASMSSAEFGEIPLNTPIPDLAKLEVHNQMFGLFGVGRYYAGSWNIRPFAEVMVGLRTFNTQQQLTAQNPQFNPEYESRSVYDRVVYTNRFHWGGSLGIHYRMNKYISFESAVSYTAGGTGAVMPLRAITREGDVLRFPHIQSPTDMLLIKAGIRIHFFSIQRSTSAGPTEPRDPTYTSPSAPRKTQPKADPPPKKKLEVKPPTKPKKIDTSDS